MIGTSQYEKHVNNLIHLNLNEGLHNIAQSKVDIMEVPQLGAQKPNTVICLIVVKKCTPQLSQNKERRRLCNYYIKFYVIIVVIHALCKIFISFHILSIKRSTSKLCDYLKFCEWHISKLLFPWRKNRSTLGLPFHREHFFFINSYSERLRFNSKFKNWL